jgi:hypothetical protein
MALTSGVFNNAKSNNLKNWIINGNFDIWQRGTSFASPIDAQYLTDRFMYAKSGAMAHTVTRDTDVPSFAQSNCYSQYSLRLNLTTPDTSIASTDYCAIQQIVEGYNWAQMAQKSFTLSFWVKATLTGTFCISLRNSGQDRSYVAEYTINNSNTWEKKTITVLPSPTSGTWDYINGKGLHISWFIAGGSNFQTTAGAWQVGQFFCTANQVNGVNTGATDFRIAQVMLNIGTEASPFKLNGETYINEIIACQRYYEKSYEIDVVPGTNTEQGTASFEQNTAPHAYGYVPYKVIKRTGAVPTLYDKVGNIGKVSGYGGDNVSFTTGGFRHTSSTGFGLEVNISSGAQPIKFHWTTTAEL